MRPFTFPQQSIYLDSLLHGATTKHNMGGAILIRGPLDSRHFIRSLEWAQQAHDALRLRFHLNGEAAAQEFEPASACSCPVETLDFSDLAEPFRSAMDWVLADFRRPMPLDGFPLHGDTLFRLAGQLHLWYPKFHHASNDAFGHSVVARTVAESYNALLMRGYLPEIESHSYSDFIDDDQAYAASDQFIQDRDFWRARFPAMPQPLPFTLRKSELARDILRTERCTLAVSRRVYDAAMSRAKDAGVTPFHLLLSFLAAYISRINGCDDLVVGTPILNRSKHAFRRTAGMFMNMMPLRIRIEDGDTVLRLALRVKAETRACYRHQRFPLGEILHRCRVLDGFCQGVFDVTLVYRKLDYDLTLGGSSMRVITLDTLARAETLSVEIDEYHGEQDVNLFFNFNPQLISPAEAAHMSRTFELLLQHVAAAGDLPVSEIRLSEHPKVAARHSANNATNLSLVDLIEGRAAEDEDAVAVICGERRITRGELDRQSRRIAAFLTDACSTRCEQPVAVLCSRDDAWIAAMMGVLKAGCAYLPLDSEMPVERLRFILRDSGCSLLLDSSETESPAFAGVRRIPVSVAVRHAGPSSRPAALSPQSLAYIIYTSGTSGKPKGVLIEHGGIANTVCELMRGWEVNARDRVLGFANPMFDASIVDAFLALVSGAPFVLASKDEILDPKRFLDLLRRQAVTLATLPPAYLSALGDVDLAPLRLIVTAGEEANPADVRRHLQRTAFVNAYGPTEASVCASYYKLEAGAELTAGRIPIGTALRHTRMVILDDSLRPLPEGSAGEICIGGAGLARGYLNRPDLDAERFLADPARDGERLYRTGDLGRQLSDGTIEFLGRRDRQVKVRGYRVEPGEVEAALRLHPGVENSAVRAWNSSSAAELVAYVVPRIDLDWRDLRRFLASRLPAYMIPSRWIRIAKLTLNSAGKVAFDMLPDPATAVDLVPARGFQAPRSDLAKTLAEIWEEVLGIAGVGEEDDFFELGGHSLKAVRVQSRIQHRLSVRVELADFFAYPTVAGLASLIGRTGGSQIAPIPTVSPMELYPLSSAQERLWVLSHMEGGSPAYNMPVAFDLKGALDEKALERAFQAVIDRHESLRTCFVSDHGIPQQKILAAADVAFELLRQDLTGMQSGEDVARLEMEQVCLRPFDLSIAPLLRAGLFRIGESRWLLSIVVHHIIADGWSLDVLLRDLQAAYANCLGSLTAGLSPLPIQYRDYSRWLAGQLKQDAWSADRVFWQRQLAEPRPVLNLPTDFVRPPTLGFAGAVDRFQLPCTSRLNLPRFCSENAVSPFLVVLAGVCGLLHRYSGDEEMIIGTPVANRDRLEVEQQIGLYLNTLALRLRLETGTTLAELLHRVRSISLEAQQHGNYPFDRLVRDLNVERSADRNPLFDVMVAMRDTLLPDFEAPGIHGKEFSVPVRASAFDLTFHFSRNGAAFYLDLEYNTGLFRRARMERLALHLDRVIESIVTTPEARLAEIDILPRHERERVLGEFANGPKVAPPGLTVIDQFAAEALENPGRPAVLFEQRSLSYGDLAAASSQLAHRIRRAGIGPGTVVALVADRSEWMVAGVIGIMASGAVCLPIDAAQPHARTTRILEDSGCRAVVSQAAALRRFAPGSLPVLAIHDAGDERGGPLATLARLSDVAYVTYTSGSTGTPKGSLIEHRSLANLMSALGPCLYDALPRPAVELMLSSIEFDVAMKQIFGALTRGNTLVVASDELRHDPARLMAAIADGGVHLLDLTPTHFAMLLAQGFAPSPKSSLRAIVLGSEPLPCSLVEPFLADPANRHIALYNFYGPSECTVESVYRRLDGVNIPSTGIASIGRPIANARVYVLSPGGQPAPIGVPGEICLGGSPVGRGYRNRPELTESQFVENPFLPGERIYRTGDLGRWSDDGMLEFIGRADDQLKIRGSRVEPGDVEFHLLNFPGVSGAAVSGRKSPTGATELVAWYTLASPIADPVSIRRHLDRLLPGYMIPTRLVEVPAFPLLPNGKIDRNALRHPAAGLPAPPEIALPPGMESTIRGLWQAVLENADVDSNTTFFDAGGNSLSLVRLHARLQERFPDAVTLTELFSVSTIAGQTGLIAERRAKAARPTGVHKGSATAPIPLRLGGTGRRRLFCFAPATGSCACYLKMARRISGWEVYGLDFVSTPAPAAALAAALARAQPSGSFTLLGYSIGGNLAYEVARELALLGRKPAALVLIDSWRRLEPFTFSNAQARENAENFVSALDSTDLGPAGREAMIRNVESYDAYMDSRFEDHALHCPICLIEAESNTLSSPFRITRQGWRELTSSFHLLRGFGPHMDMLNEPHIDQNSRLVQRLLETIHTVERAESPKAPAGPQVGGLHPLPDPSTVLGAKVDSA